MNGGFVPSMIHQIHSASAQVASKTTTAQHVCQDELVSAGRHMHSHVGRKGWNKKNDTTQ